MFGGKEEDGLRVGWAFGEKIGKERAGIRQSSARIIFEGGWSRWVLCILRSKRGGWMNKLSVCIRPDTEGNQKHNGAIIKESMDEAIVTI